MAEVRNSSHQTMSLKSIDENRRSILQWLSPDDVRKTQKEVFEAHQAGTGQWLLQRSEFLEWLEGSQFLLWCYGDRMWTSVSQIESLADPD